MLRSFFNKLTLPTVLKDYASFVSNEITKSFFGVR